jgi:hypothetical protein
MRLKTAVVPGGFGTTANAVGTVRRPEMELVARFGWTRLFPRAFLLHPRIGSGKALAGLAGFNSLICDTG